MHRVLSQGFSFDEIQNRVEGTHAMRREKKKTKICGDPGLTSSLQRAVLSYLVVELGARKTTRKLSGAWL